MIKEWIKKLYQMCSTNEEMKLRNDYLWFLVVQLQSGHLDEPFLRLPVQKLVVPIAQAVVVIQNLTIIVLLYLPPKRYYIN